jgi:membrane-associated phospholipid phosphatase
MPLPVAQFLADPPGWLVVCFALVTQLGDPWFVFVLVTLCYWLGDDRFSERPRRAGATLIALGLCALVTTIAFKSGFALPRPPGAGEATPPAWLPPAFGSTFVGMATGDGFGFPSGHALGTTAVYGGIAVLYDRLWSRRRRYAAAAVVVGLVSLSRLVLGVHAVADVVAGVVTGLVVLAVTLRLSENATHPDRAYLLAAAVGVLALVATWLAGHTGESYEAALGFGSALGGAAGWVGFDVRERVGPGLSALSLVVCGGIWGTVYRLEPTLPGTVVGAAIAVGGIVAVPALAARMGSKEVPADGV